MSAFRNDMATAQFWEAAFWRAFRSFCQALVTLGGINSTELLSTSWATIFIAAAGYAVTSVLTSIVTGLPEATHDPLYYPGGETE